MNRNTIIRTAILFVALLNQVLTMSGKNPLPFSEGEIYELLTMVITAGASNYCMVEKITHLPKRHKKQTNI